MSNPQPIGFTVIAPQGVTLLDAQGRPALVFADQVEFKVRAIERIDPRNSEAARWPLIKAESEWILVLEAHIISDKVTAHL